MSTFALTPVTGRLRVQQDADHGARHAGRQAGLDSAGVGASGHIVELGAKSLQLVIANPPPLTRVDPYCLAAPCTPNTPLSMPPRPTKACSVRLLLERRDLVEDDRSGRPAGGRA